MNKITNTANKALTSSSFSENDLMNLMEDILTYGKSIGADGIQSFLAVENGFNVNIRNSDVETLEHHQEKGLDITIFHRQQTGRATTSDFSKAAVRSAIDKAFAIANYTQPDLFAGLADPELMAFNYPNLQLYHPWNITPAEAIEMAIEFETVACEQDSRIIHSEGASVSTFNSFIIYGNSHQFIGSYSTTIHTISCGLIAEQNNQKQRDYDYSTNRRPEELENSILLAKKVAQKTLARLGARPIKTRKCPVIFFAPIAKSLLRHFVTAISGSQIYREESFLLGKLGQPIFPSYIHIHQQPHLLSALGSAPFDGEGVMTSNIDYVTEGILTQYILSSYSARKLGLKTTGNAGGVFNLEVSHSHFNLNDLMHQMDTGLLVTELLGQGVNITTGNYSRGAAGFWVEKGEIQFPVEQVTIAANLADMFLNLVCIANDVDYRGSVRTGSILVDNMVIAG